MKVVETRVKRHIVVRVHYTLIYICIHSVRDQVGRLHCISRRCNYRIMQIVDGRFVIQTESSRLKYHFDSQGYFVRHKCSDLLA